jgi:hypothetical protein
MLSDAHRQAIADTLVNCEVDLERVYLQLERILEGYQILERDRELNPDTLSHLQREQERISELITRWRWRKEDLRMQLDDFQQHPIAGHDEIEPELCQLIHEVETELTNLETIQRRIHSHIDNLNALIRKFRGKSNPYRENMYVGVLRVWTDIIGRELTYSRSPRGGPPYGLLLQFFHVCLLPILNDKTPRAERLSKIIDRERHVRRKTV